MNYRNRSTEDLVRMYACEADRINRNDAEFTKANIRGELIRRFHGFMRLLDDEQTLENPTATFNYLLGK